MASGSQSRKGNETGRLGGLLEIVELLDCRRECLIHVFSELLNHDSRSSNYLIICSKGFYVMVYAPFPERVPVGSARIALLQRMDIFDESSLCVNWSWKEFKNGVLLPLPAWKEC